MAEFGEDNAVLSVDGAAVSGRNYGDTVYPVNNFFVGENELVFEEFMN